MIQEGYHIPTIHPGLNKEFQSKMYKVTNYETNGKFSVHACPPRDNAQMSAVWLWVKRKK